MLAVGSSNAATRPPAHGHHSHHGGSLGRVIPAGKATSVTVSPGRAQHVSVRHVGRLSIPRGAVARRAVFVLRPYRARLTAGAQAAALGLDIKVKGDTLRKPLTWVQRVGSAPDGTVALFVHRGDDGSWELRRAKVSHGRITLRTKRWSINVPAWLNPKEWAHWLGDRVAASLGGRTSPWTCPNPPSWMNVQKLADTVHACAQNNPDGAGARAELRLKSNRGSVLQVTVNGRPDYVWVKSQSDGVRQILAKLTGTNTANTVFLAPGDDGLMTVGYRQPAQTQNAGVQVDVSGWSVIMSVVYAAADVAVDKVAAHVKYAGTAYLLAKCSKTVNLQAGQFHNPRDFVSDARFWDVWTCFVREGAEEFTDRAKVAKAVIELNDRRITGMDSAEYGRQLDQMGKSLKVLSWILVARPFLQIGWGGVADAVKNALNGGASRYVNVTLQGGGGPTGGAPSGGAPTGGGSAGGSPSGGDGGPVPGTAETAGGVARTWTNYSNAGGSEGASVGAQQTIGIECKVQGFQVANGNPWWYRIASAPWNGQYYVSADAFYNNGQRSGPLAGTPWVDAAVPDCAPSTPPVQPPIQPPPPTWAETVGGPSHTWTNWTNAGGQEGPTIPSFTTVQIACKLPGFRVADGNTWWYRIASAPWNGQFYVSADAFYNNGQTSGSLRGTPFVDPAVANC